MFTQQMSTATTYVPTSLVDMFSQMLHAVSGLVPQTTVAQSAGHHVSSMSLGAWCHRSGVHLSAAPHTLCPLLLSAYLRSTAPPMHAIVGTGTSESLKS